MTYSYESHHFEDFEESKESQSVGRTVTRADFVTRPTLSGDWTELHTSSEYAGDTQFGQRIAHGPVTFIRSTDFVYRSGAVEHTTITFLEMNYMDLPNPVLIGDALSQTMVISERKDLESRDDAGLVVLEIEVTKQDDAIVLEDDVKFLIKTKSAAE